MADPIQFSRGPHAYTLAVESPDRPLPDGASRVDAATRAQLVEWLIGHRPGLARQLGGLLGFGSCTDERLCWRLLALTHAPGTGLVMARVTKTIEGSVAKRDAPLEQVDATVEQVIADAPPSPSPKPEPKSEPDCPKTGQAKWTDHCATIKAKVDALNARHSPDEPLDFKLVRAMMAVETSPGTDARAHDPLQTSNAGDHALKVFKDGITTWDKDRSEYHYSTLINPQLATKLAGKQPTPRKAGAWDYAGMDASARMDADTGIELGVSYLFLKAANFGLETSESGPVEKVEVVAGDNPTTIARRVGTTVDVLAKYNPTMSAKGLQIGQVLNYRAATRAHTIQSWDSWMDAVEAYNGGGDPSYRSKVEAEYAIIERCFPSC